MNTKRGNLRGEGLRIGIVVSRFNENVSKYLLEGAYEALIQMGTREDDISIFEVPGSFEIPLTIKKLIQEGDKLDGIIALGAIIRGETPHFDFVAGEVTRSLGRIVLDHSFPVSFGIITADTPEQAMERAGGKMGNRGREAALTLIETINLLKEISEGKTSKK